LHREPQILSQPASGSETNLRLSPVFCIPKNFCFLSDARCHRVNPGWWSDGIFQQANLTGNLIKSFAKAECCFVRNKMQASKFQTPFRRWALANFSTRAPASASVMFHKQCGVANRQ
jgi:hypothetical protein